MAAIASWGGIDVRRLILAAVLAFGGTAATAATLPWTDLVVFGDSLSDAGNLGVATNGEVWAERLGALPSTAGGLNYAFGGARAVSTDAAVGPAPGVDVPDFAEQRALFAAAGETLGNDPLVVAWFGGNDLLNAGGNAAVIGQAVQAIGAGVSELATRFGLRRFILPNLPDLSRIPANANEPAPVRIAAQQATLGFNGGLETLATTLGLGGLDVRVFDTAALFADILADPAAFGFDATLDLTEATCLRGQIDCAGYLFWDPIHPTAAAHALIADGIAELAAIPLPATIWLLAGGLGAVVAVGRRRKAA